MLEIYDEQTVRDYWIQHGNRKTAHHFGVPVSSIDHLKIVYHWKRPMENANHILWGVARGKTHPSKYHHLTFQIPNSSDSYPSQDKIQRHAYYLLKKGTFIGWCIINDGFTYCHDIYM